MIINQTSAQVRGKKKMPGWLPPAKEMVVFHTLCIEVVYGPGNGVKRGKTSIQESTVSELMMRLKS